MSLVSICLAEDPDDEAAVIFLRSRLNARDLAADALGIGDDQSFGQAQNANGAAQQREVPLIAVPVLALHAARLTILGRIQFRDIVVEIAEQPLEYFRQVFHRPVAHADVRGSSRRQKSNGASVLKTG